MSVVYNIPSQAASGGTLPLVMAFVGAVLALLSALYTAWQKQKYDMKLETYKNDAEQRMANFQAVIDERHSEAAAKREYEYDARKKLYTECEPLVFQFTDCATNAYYCIQGLARNTRKQVLQQENFLGKFDYYYISTIYKLLAPVAVYQMIQQKLTFVDLKLDDKLRLQYRIIRNSYLLWTADNEIAEAAGLKYDANNKDWAALRLENQAEYWRQGLPMGVLDILVSFLVTKENSVKCLMTYVDFENKVKTDAVTQQQIKLMTDVLDGFTPSGRPVLWTMLMTQAVLYHGLLKMQADEKPEFAAGGAWYNKYFELDGAEAEKFYTNSGPEAKQEMGRVLEAGEKYIRTMLLA